MLWRGMKSRKLKAKVENAAADNDSVTHRNNEEDAKRLEFDLGKLLECNSATEAEKEGRI
jgi:hypothetical protein